MTLWHCDRCRVDVAHNHAGVCQRCQRSDRIEVSTITVGQYLKLDSRNPIFEDAPLVGSRHENRFLRRALRCRHRNRHSRCRVHSARRQVMSEPMITLDEFVERLPVLALAFAAATKAQRQNGDRSFVLVRHEVDWFRELSAWASYVELQEIVIERERRRGQS